MSGGRLLITGASGMVGRALLSRLASADAPPSFEDLLTPSSKELDLRDQSAVQAYFQAERPERVVHLAGHIGGIRASISRPVEFFYENLVMAMNVIHAAYEADAKRLLFIGSSCIYPRACPQPMAEDSLLTGSLEPTNEGYSIAKVAGIKLCEFLNRQHGTDFLSLIPCNLYGPHDSFDSPDGHVVSSLLSRLHAAKLEQAPSVEIWGTGTTRREFLFVDDMADSICHFLERGRGESPHEVFNVGTGQDLTIRSLAEKIKQVVGYEGELVFNPDKPDGMPRKCLDVARTSAHGWQAKIDVDQGLARAYAWYTANRKKRVEA
ncbi:MAG: GDP-L-fucose synthase [Planctomycetes bacterium]|nr:GDP-L-fucose synthase [Planctomycetota bacterium]